VEKKDVLQIVGEKKDSLVCRCICWGVFVYNKYNNVNIVFRPAADCFTNPLPMAPPPLYFAVPPLNPLPRGPRVFPGGAIFVMILQPKRLLTSAVTVSDIYHMLPVRPKAEGDPSPPRPGFQPTCSRLPPLAS